MRIIIRSAVLLSVLSVAHHAQAASLPVTAGLTVQFDASNPLGTGALPDGTVLSTWKNLAPSLQQDGVASAGIGTNPGNTAPTIRTTESNAPPSGLPVVEFNGTTDLLQTALFTTPIAQPSQIFVVWFAAPSPGAGEIAFDGLTGTSRQSGDVENNGSNVINQYAGSGNFIPFTFTNPIEQSYTYKGAASSFTIDGTTVATGNPGTDSLDGVTLGGRFQPFGGFAYGLHGYLAEVLVYNTALSPSNTTAVENYLIQKWFTPVPEPSTCAMALIATLGMVAMAVRTRRGRSVA